MSEKKVMGNSNQMVAVLLDVIGIILVVVGALYNHYHEGSSSAEGVFWIGVVLLIVSLIIFMLNLRKANVEKA